MFLAALTCSLTIFSFGQSAPLGKDLVRLFSEKIQSYQTIKTVFAFTLENLQEGLTDTYDGTLSYKGKQYNLSLMGMEVYYDGETKWQYIPEANEVTISKPLHLMAACLMILPEYSATTRRISNRDLLANRLKRVWVSTKLILS